MKNLLMARKQIYLERLRVVDKKSSEIIYTFEKQSDIEIAMDLVSKYYLIQNSVLIKFQRKAKEQLSLRAEDAIQTMISPVAKRLLSITINK